MISYRCVCTVSTYTTFLFRLTLFCYGQLILTLGWQWIPKRLPKKVSPQAKITLLPKISQNKPIRSFILALLQSQLRDLWVTAARCTVIQYVYIHAFYEAECFYSLHSPIKDGAFLHFTQPVVPLCVAWGFGWRLTLLLFVPLQSGLISVSK